MKNCDLTLHISFNTQNQSVKRIEKMARKSKGFTLVEVVASLTIFMVAAALAMSGYILLSKKAQQRNTQNELNNDAQTAIERLKTDMRLSSMNQIFYYPKGNPPYTAVSFPVAYDSDGDGVIERDSSGMIIWDDTIIYHIRRGSPDELVRTLVSSRNNSLSDSQRQFQLDKVVDTGSGDTAVTAGETAKSTVIFKNLLNWSLTPRIGSFVCYAPSRMQETINMGYVLLEPGNHEFQFTVEPRSTSSTGNLIGIDSLTVSPSYLPREAEACLPATRSSGATPTAQYNSSYSGKTLLSYAGQAGDSFTITMDNDRWEDTNFGGRYSIQSNTVINTHYDSVTAPIIADNVIELDGNKMAWEAAEQCGDYSGSGSGTNLMGKVIRVMLKGSSLPAGGSHILGSGAKTKFTFAAAPLSGLKIGDVVFGESISSNTQDMAYVPSTILEIPFNNGGTVNNSTTIPANSRKESEWMELAIDPNKNYILSYSIIDGSPMVWNDVNTTLPAASQIAVDYPGYLPSEMALMSANWNTISTAYVIEPSVVLGLESVFVTYAEQGIYTSDIIDTRIDSPTYDYFMWDADIPGNTEVAFKVRTGNNPGLLDAPSFDSLTPTVALLGSSSFALSGSGRYVQYQALLDATVEKGQITPRLRNTAITWVGERRMMEISGVFSKGPDHGNFSLSIDGEGLQSAMMVDLEIYRDVLSVGKTNTTQRISSEIQIALTPRNSGL